MVLNRLDCFFAKKTNLFDNKYMALERNRYFNNNGMSVLTELDCESMLFEIFKSKIKPEIAFLGLAISDDRIYTIRYACRRSLRQYFSSQRIDNDMTFKADDSSENSRIFEIKKRFKQSTKHLYRQFFIHLKMSDGVDIKLIHMDNAKIFLRQFERAATAHMALIHFREILAGLPFAVFIAALVFLGTMDYPLLDTMVSYIKKSEKHLVSGFYYIWGVVLAISLIGMAPCLTVLRDCENHRNGFVRCAILINSALLILPIIFKLFIWSSFFSFVVEIILLFSIFSLGNFEDHFL